MNKKLELLRILFWVLGGIYVVGALIFAVVGLLGGMGVIDPKDTLHERIAGGLGAGIFGLSGALLGGAHLVVGSALRRLRPWARTAGLVVAILDILICCSAPLGTAVGIYALVVLFNDEVVRLFAEQE
ncbi:MAG TPA: hypothetical protein VMM84_13095 [Pyrinomonadaceae bacterium]|nr:hypothetical protein [Pyrinomonadaceae bacterium]